MGPGGSQAPVNTAQLATRLEALLLEFGAATEHPEPAPHGIGHPIGTPAELTAAELAIARAATTSLDLFEPSARAAADGWAPLAPLRCGGGVRVRIVRAPATEVAGPVDGAVRVSELVTARLLIRDRAEAVLATGGPGGTPGGALRATHPAVVDYLVTVFESVWEHALPSSECPAPAGRALSADDHELLDQLLLGRTDESIARALSVSVRTVQRRAAALQHRLGVSGRFQLGLRVGLGEVPRSVPGGR